MDFRVGLVVQNTVETNVIGRALWAESQGYESLWVGEHGVRMNALTLMGALAAATRKPRLGMGILPVFTHPPAVLASAMMTLQHLAPGRIVLGLGSSSKPMMENWNGIPFAKPLTRVKETVTVLRQMLAGEKVSFEGDSLSTSGFKLFWPVPEETPIMVAALRPKMLEMAGELADGVILHMAPPSSIPALLDHVRTGAERAGRSLSDLEIVLRVNTYVTDNQAAAYDEFRQVALGYFSADVYNKFFAWCGYEAEAKEIAAGFATKDRKRTQAAATQAMLDDLGVIGDRETCQEKIRQLAALGVNTVVINPATNHLEAAQATMEAFSPINFQP